MLTPKDLQNHQFQLSGRNGYLAADVDEYMDEVYSSYDQMFRENAEIVRKLQVLADRLAKYKDDEENIRNALVAAHEKLHHRRGTAKGPGPAVRDRGEDPRRQRIRGRSVRRDPRQGSCRGRRDPERCPRRSRGDHRACQQEGDNIDTADAIYEEKVGSVAEEAAKQEAYLEKVKVESAKIRKQLSDTYQMQMELLSFAPDFTSEVEHVELPEDVEKTPVEETFVTGEEVLGERKYQETQERLEAEAKAPEEEAEPEVIEEPEEEPAAKPAEEPAPAPVVEEEDDDGFGDIDKYLAGNSYEDLNDGNKYFK